MAESDEIRVGLIGSGLLGAIHAAGLAAIPGCRLVAATAPLPGAADVAVRDSDAICNPALVDAVIVATPTDTHAAYVSCAIEAGLPIFCEKPLARTVAEAERIRAQAEEQSVMVAVGHVVRYFPEYAAARELVSRGELGTPITARLVRLNSSPATLSSWYADSGRSGGVLLDMAIHDVDWCLWTFGSAERVYAVRTGEPGHEVASVTIRHRAGTIAYVDASWRNPVFATSLEVCGTSGLYQADGSSSAGFRLVEAQRAAGTGYLPSAAASPVQDDPYVLELRAAIDWFRGGEPPRASVADACEALRAVAAAEESARTGVPVAIGEDGS